MLTLKINKKIFSGLLFLTMLMLTLNSLKAIAYENAVLENRPSKDSSNKSSKIDKKWLVILNDPRPARDKGWKSGRYRQSGGYKNNLSLKRLTNEIVEAYPIKLVTEWPIKSINVHCLVVTFGEGSEDKIFSELTQDPRVKWVQHYQLFEGKSLQKSSPSDRKKTPSNEETLPNNKHADPYLNLQAIFPQLNLSKITADLNGAGINIAMIDSGVDENHPELKGVLKEQLDFVESSAGTIPAEHHGTGIAGIIVAKRNNGIGISGIAPAANLYAYRSCWESKDGNTHCDTLSLARALDRVAELQPDILNLSLTGPKDQLLDLIIKNIISNNTQIIAAYDDSRLPSQRFPSAQSGVFFVASFADKIPAEIVSTSQIFIAPGNKILTTQPGGTYDFISGSSMATANITSIFALIKQKSPNINLNKLTLELSTASETTKEYSQTFIITDACRLMKKMIPSHRCH